MGKTNPWTIVQKQFATYYAWHPVQQKRKLAPMDFAVMLGVPLVVAAGLLAAVQSPKPLAELLATAVSVLLGLLLSMLVVILDLVKTHEAKLSDKAKELARETIVNASYAILIALGFLAFLVCRALDFEPGLVSLLGKAAQPISNALSFLVYALLVHFGLALLMVLKRAFSLQNEVFGEEA